MWANVSNGSFLNISQGHNLENRNNIVMIFQIVSQGCVQKSPACWYGEGRNSIECSCLHRKTPLMFYFNDKELIISYMNYTSNRHEELDVYNSKFLS